MCFSTPARCVVDWWRVRRYSHTITRSLQAEPITTRNWTVLVTEVFTVSARCDPFIHCINLLCCSLQATADEPRDIHSAANHTLYGVRLVLKGKTSVRVSATASAGKPTHPHGPHPVM